MTTETKFYVNIVSKKSYKGPVTYVYINC